MKNQAFNPYLPLNTYIPDAEPHVFGDRVYVYGSHDKEGGETFCMLDYEVWSAPVEDLSDWSCHGISYRAGQDPTRDERHQYMYAPDVVRGNDGRYYLFYALAHPDFTGPIHVAVSDRPEGPFVWHGELRTEDGQIFDRNISFDPGVLNDGGVIRLYYGWALASDRTAGMSKAQRKQMAPMIRVMEQRLFQKTEAQIDREPEGLEGAFTVTLADDMLTVTSEPKRILPGQMDAAETGFEGHAFFEASSMRKIGDVYYFIYSSERSHELCYATSRYPDRDFRFGGTIISNGDIGYQGRKPEDRLAATGNTHGSIECIGGQWYVFYHRQTHMSSYSRQGCAEPIFFRPDGGIDQVEMSSCGLNGGPLKPVGEIPAAVACNLTNGHMPHISAEENYPVLPCVTHRGTERFITDIVDGTRIVYKSFAFRGETKLTLRCRGEGNGIFELFTGEEKAGEMAVPVSEGWTDSTVRFTVRGVRALRIIYRGEGRAELLSLLFYS